MRWANLFAHRTQPRGNCETTITTATADAGQRETAITNARPQTATIETTITSATEKHITNAHVSPAKAMTVSVGSEPARAKAMAVSSEARPARAKATPVSRERFVMPAGYGGAWPSDQRAADVTNVVKPPRFKSPREDLCYKRRQSEPKNQHFHRKSHWIDDVCNNNAEIHTKNSSD
ncbi:hypothetical protein [Schaalia odontolytica]|uniref:Uncharacterized protein n=1 Tax=Schaalia odontolytica TaxID=1660 RepID=A0A857A628_9ACTO|nr:hypothetical protein [Schaalia odontolytica]QGS10134.1 hypothetical protein FOC40_01040 [Schaalia odontolytica]